MQKKILLIDDESSVRRTISLALNQEGYDVEPCENGFNALKKLDVLKQNNINLDSIVLDIILPDIDGIKLSKIIKEKYPGIPIVFITGYANKVVDQEIDKEYLVTQLKKLEELLKKNDMNAEDHVESMMKYLSKWDVNPKFDSLEALICKLDFNRASLLLSEIAEELEINLFRFFLEDPCDYFVLIAWGYRDIDHKQDHVGIRDRRYSLFDHKLVEFVPWLFMDAGCVDEDELVCRLGEYATDARACGLGLA